MDARGYCRSRAVGPRAWLTDVVYPRDLYRRIALVLCAKYRVDRVRPVEADGRARALYCPVQDSVLYCPVQDSAVRP
jgi:hypothetical protein